MEFQSLSGFQVRCNLRNFSFSGLDLGCFNPYRVFKFVATEGGQGGSISIGRFQSLSGFQVRCNELPETHDRLIFMFQSLSGFQVRCNIAGSPLSFRKLEVSIPIGFSSSLQLGQDLVSYRSDEKVSIPIGFSSSLQLYNRDGCCPGRMVSIPIGFSSSLQPAQCCTDEQP